jgi:hypothetical protein
VLKPDHGRRYSGDRSAPPPVSQRQRGSVDRHAFLDQAAADHRGRLAAAVAADDRPGVIGAAKELIECVARCVLDATERPVGDKEDFNAVIRAAQKALERVAGNDVSSSPDVKVIAGAAQSIAVRANVIRNQVGTGHGRARVADIDDEMAEIAADGAMLWSRWALRRLGHLMARYPTRLLSALAGGAYRDRLRTAFEEVQLPDQPKEVQHAIGVAFGREAAGGFGNASVVGLRPAVDSPDLDVYTVDYRLGLVDGMVINGEGQIALTEHYVPRLVDVLAPIPGARAVQAINELAETAKAASWITRWRGETVTPAATVAALRAEQGRLTPELQAPIAALADALDPATRHQLT